MNLRCITCSNMISTRLFLQAHPQGGMLSSRSQTHYISQTGGQIKASYIPGELGHSLQEPGGVAVQRHAAALEASRSAQLSPSAFYSGPKPRVSPAATQRPRENAHRLHIDG